MRGIPVPQGRTANTEVRSKRSSPEHAPAGPAGRATGGIYLAIFGALWAVAGVGGVGGFEAPAILRWTMVAVIGAVTLGLCLQSVRLARRVRILPRDATSAADATRRRVNRRFGLIVTI